jgi:uncharacterized protein YegL
LDEFKIEDTVVLIDCSRSMIRSDFKPRRLIVALKSVRNFISSKISIDPKDRIMLITYGRRTKRLSPFTNDENQLFNSLKKIEISGRGKLYEGIAFALQVLGEEMRKIGGKVQRIFIITDGKIQAEKSKFEKLVDIAQGLGIFIDVCQIGKSLHYQEDYLKIITQKTNGEFGYFNNSRALISSGKEFASKKNLRKTSDYFSPSRTEKSSPPLVSDIAVELRRPTITEIKAMMGGKGQEMCQICHSIKNPINGADFFASGRYCPSCGRPYHLHCAALWAKKSEYADNIFRCPFCYFLLRVPQSIMKMVKKASPKLSGIKIIDEMDKKSTRMVKTPKEKIKNIDQSCSQCRNIFIGQYDVYRCENCGAYYHEPCLNKMYNETKSCRNCGAIIK